MHNCVGAEVDDARRGVKGTQSPSVLVGQDGRGGRGELRMGKREGEREIGGGAVSST